MTGQPNSSSLKPVWVFFRMFVTQTSDTDYDPLSSYLSSPDAAGLPDSPLLGVGNVTIPFFATGNYETNNDFPANADYITSGINALPITIGASGSVWAYYGCYLNIYRTDNTIAGRSVQAMFPGTHNCLVAQIAYDDAPIATAPGTTVSPANSDELAQRNLEITLSYNPGPADTHRVPQTFDLRPGVAPASRSGNLLDYPDELMIDWGNTPVGTIAHIYWPQVNVSDVLSLAKRVYSTHQLSAADANTVRCTVPHGLTFVPIPPGVGENFAGLLTLELPLTVSTGQVFTIVVRRLTTRHAVEQPPPPPIPITSPHVAGGVFSGQPGAAAGALASHAREKRTTNWRSVTGNFAVRIPVTTGKRMLPLEEDTLAIMKWRLAQWPRGVRWYPVLLRYIEYISRRVDGLGGDSSAVRPSPWGAHPAPEKDGTGEKHHRRHEHTGKVTGLIFDRFGDFEGFELDTESGERTYLSREKEIKILAERAWRERLRITVWSEWHDSRRPLSIIVREPPVPFTGS